MKDLKGIESSFISSWAGWDEMDTSDLYFYDVELLPNVFPEEVYNAVAEGKVKGFSTDLYISGQGSILEISIEGEDVFSSKIKLVLVEEV